MVTPLYSRSAETNRMTLIAASTTDDRMYTGLYAHEPAARGAGYSPYYRPSTSSAPASPWAAVQLRAGEHGALTSTSE